MDFNSFDDRLIAGLPIVLKTKLNLFLSELHVLFSTEKGSVLGNRNFGNSIEHYLWSTTYNSSLIVSSVTQNILDFCLTNTYFSWEVQFNMIKGISKDIGVVDVIIKNFEDNSTIANPQWIFK